LNTREPILNPVAIEELRPTQMTVGFREVAEKRREWRDRSDENAGEYLGKHMVPAVLGPKGRYYLVDHHHLALALHEEKQAKVLVTVIADLSALPKASQAARLRRHPQDCLGPRRRSLPQPFRRAAPRRRLRQGHHAVQRIPLGRFPATAHPPQADQRALFRRGREGAGAGKVRRGGLPAGVVRPASRLDSAAVRRDHRRTRTT
jgi:hypothetical protein